VEPFVKWFLVCTAFAALCVSLIPDIYNSYVFERPTQAVSQTVSDDHIREIAAQEVAARAMSDVSGLASQAYVDSAVQESSHAVSQQISVVMQRADTLEKAGRPSWLIVAGAICGALALCGCVYLFVRWRRGQ
jgi:hypothetical protein